MFAGQQPGEKFKQPPPDGYRCTVIVRSTGERCKKWAVRSGICRTHGANLPGPVRAEELRNRHAKLRLAMDTYGLPRNVDPGQALLEEIQRTAGHVQWLGEKVRELKPEELVWGRSKRTLSGRASADAESSGEEETAPAERTDDLAEAGWRSEIVYSSEYNAYLRLYLVERRNLIEVIKTAHACGIEERRIKLAEDQGSMIADVLRRMLDDPTLGLSDEQKRVGRSLAVRELRALSSATAEIVNG